MRPDERRAGIARRRGIGERGLELGQRADFVNRKPEAAPDGRDVTRRWRAEEGLERRLVHDASLGQEREDAASAVVDDDKGAGHRRQVDQSGHVVQEGQVTKQADGAVAASAAGHH